MKKDAINAPANSIIWDVWEGYPTRLYISSKCEVILEGLNTNSSPYLIVDLRKARGTFIHSAKYLQGFFRQLKFFGVQKMAYLLPADEALVIRAAEIVLQGNCYVEYQFFFEEKEALDWINEQDSGSKAPGLSNCERLIVNADRQTVFVPLEEINFVAADGHHCNVHTLDDVFRINSSLKDIDQILPKNTFQRIHKSYIVNTSRIKRAASVSPHSFILMMEGLKNIKIPIGKRYLKNCKRLLGMK